VCSSDLTEREDILVDSLTTMYVGEIASAHQAHNEQIIARLREQSDSYLDIQGEILANAGFVVTTTTRIGPPAEVIVEVATHVNAAAIVIATHGYSGLQRWSVGSVADKVVHATNVPVLLVRGRVDASMIEPKFEQLLVALDGSELANQALPIATELAQHTHAKITLLHAIDPLVEAYPSARGLSQSLAHPDRLLHELTDSATRQLHERAEAIYTNEHVEATPMTLIGYPAEVIVDEAERRHADLIVMATHGYSGLRRWALGSTTDKVLHSTRTPLLVVRVQHAAN